MPEALGNDGLAAVSKNLSNNETEISSAYEKRISHIFDAANIASKRITEELKSDSAVKSILKSDGVFDILEDLLLRAPSLSFGEPTSFSEYLCEKFLSRFDGMCFCKGIASAESVSLSELFVCIYGEAQDNSKPGRERQIALLRNSGSSRAFELFAKNLRGVEAYYGDNFQSLCAGVSSGDAKYAIVPIESGSDGRLDGLHRVIERYSLSVLMTCRVRAHDGSVTKYALVGKPSPLVGYDGELKFEFRITFGSADEVINICDAARFFGADVERIDSLSGVFGGRDNSFDFILDVSCADMAGLLTYMSIYYSQFVTVGIYKHITEE